TFTLPLAIYVLATFFREIPWELEQAAQVDGATPWQAFTKVIAPLAAPGVFTTAILVFIFAWNDFIFAVSLTATSSAQTVPAALFQFPGAAQVQSPTGLAPPAGGAVPGADRLDRRGGDRRHNPHCSHGPVLPAAHRGRADRRRREGLKGIAHG